VSAFVKANEACGKARRSGVSFLIGETIKTRSFAFLFDVFPVRMEPNK
jgi:hypothetical protein